MTPPTCGQEVHNVGCSGETHVFAIAGNESVFLRLRPLIILLNQCVFSAFSSGCGRDASPRPRLYPLKSPSNPPDLCLQLS